MFSAHRVGPAACGVVAEVTLQPMNHRDMDMFYHSFVAALPILISSQEAEALSTATRRLFFSGDNSQVWVAAVEAEVRASMTLLGSAAATHVAAIDPRHIVALAGLWIVAKLLTACCNVSLSEVAKKVLLGRVLADEEEDDEPSQGLFELHRTLDGVICLVTAAERSILVRHDFALPFLFATPA